MPEPFLTGLLTAALFRAVEKIWEESAKAAWTPGTDAIRAQFLRWTGKGKERQRRIAFGKAEVTARANTIKRADDPAAAREVLALLDGKIDKRAAEVLGEEGAKLLLFADRPDLDRLARVCQRTVGFEAIVSGEETLSAATIAPVLADFLDNLREALLDQEAYADLVQKDMRSVLREILAELRPVDYDDEAIYRQQMAEMHSRLDFVGIPELKEDGRSRSMMFLLACGSSAQSRIVLVSHFERRLLRSLSYPLKPLTLRAVLGLQRSRKSKLVA